MRDWERLVDRYVAGELDAEETRALWAWVGDDPQRRALVEGLKAERERLRGRPESVDVNAASAAFWQVARTARPVVGTLQIVRGITPRRGGVRRDRPAFVWRAVGVAAAVLIGVGLTLTTIQLGVWRTPAAFREFASAPGSRTTITLRDGTRLVLGPATRLRVSRDFGRATRTVELDGEALFTVVHDEAHPFAVKTARTTVRDVGTTFVVRAYAQDPEERVAVNEGEVALPGAHLRARDMASVDANGRVSVRRNVDVTAYMNWVQGALVFKDTPLKDVVRELARTYDLDVTVADTALDAELISASFNAESADEVLDVVTHIVGAHYTRSGREVVIRRGVLPVGRPDAGSESAQRMVRGRSTR